MPNKTHRASPRYKISDFFSSLLDQWEHEAAVRRTEQLKLMDKKDLRAEVVSEFQRSREQFHEQEAQRILDEKRQWQTGHYKPLPRTWNGQRLDARFIRAASPQLIRQLREHYGSLQLDLRLRGEN